MENIWKISLVVILVFLVLPLVSAELTFDNIKSFDDKIGDYGKVTIKDWFGLLNLAELELKHNTDKCYADCSSETEIVLYQDGALIDDVRFMALKDDDTWVSEPINSYQFYIKTSGSEWLVDDYENQCVTNVLDVLKNLTEYVCNDVKVGTHYENNYTWKEYNLGEEVKAGTYYVKLEGEKKYGTTIDWQITSQGKLIEDWAEWTFGEYTGVHWDTSGTGTVPYGTTTNNTNFWIMDSIRAQVYQTDIIGNIIKNWSIAGQSLGSGYGSDMTNNNSRIWISSYQANEIYFFDMDGTYINSWDTSGECSDTAGVTTNNSIIWVLCRADKTVYIYTMAGVYTSISFPIPETLEAWGIETGHNYHYITDRTLDTILRYEMGGTYIENFSVADQDGNPFAMTVNETLVFVLGYNSQEMYLYGTGYTAPSVVTTILNSPDDDYGSTTNSISFNCSASIVGSATIQNISLWTNMSGAWILNETEDFTGVGGSANTSTFIKNLPEGTIDWTCRAFDSSGVSDWGTNRTVSVDTIDPYVNIIFPANITYNLNVSTLNYTSDGTYCWNTGTTNSSIVNCGMNWTFLTSTEGSNTWIVYSNDTANNTNSSSVTFFKDTIYPLIYFGTNTAVDNANLTQSNVYVNVSATETNFANITFILYNDTQIINSTTYTTITYTINWTGLADNNYTYEVNISDIVNNKNSTGVRTINLDTTVPSVTINQPTGKLNYGYEGKAETLNWTVVDTNFGSVWYNYNGTNYTLVGAINTTSFYLKTSPFNLTLWANDSLGNQNSATTTWSYRIFNNGETYNNFSYETASETFAINVTANVSLTAANLIYKGTSYAGTQSGLVWSKTLQIPTGSVNNEFNWSFTYAGNQITSLSNIQTINHTNLSICGGEGGSIIFLNFSFIDETAGTPLNASTDLADFDYWLGDGTVTKNYIFTNTTDNFNYNFCAIPNRTITTDLQYKFSKTGYPQRTFAYDDQALSNTTTHQTLYLLASADGIYSSIAVQSSVGVGISGVLVVIEREIGGVFTIISQGTTGSDGLVTFWVNPNYVHRITATKTGYTSVQVSITPSQSIYTILMGTVGSGAFNSSQEGLKWFISPAIGPLEPRINQKFNATIISDGTKTIVNCSFELLNEGNLTVLTTDTDATNSTYCFMDITYTTTNNQNIFGRLSVDTGDGLFILDTDYKWILVDLDLKSWRTLTSFFSDLKDLSEFGEGNEAEFNRYVLFFLVTTILLAAFMFFSGVELQNPGANLIIIWGIVAIASFGGFLTFESGIDNIAPFFEQFGFFIMLTLLLGGVYLNLLRKTMD